MNIYKDLTGLLTDDKVFENEPMKKHTSFKIGGNAQTLVFPQNAEDFKKVIRYAVSNNIPWFVMGNGSNLLVNDEGIAGIVIKTAGRFDRITAKGECLICEAGALISKISSLCQSLSLSGFEELSGIPGTLGGGIYMNAGAYGRELSDVIEDVTFMDTDGNILTLKNEDLNFSYRHSYFSEKSLIILSAVLRLMPGNKQEITARTQEFKLKRRDKQPIEFPSAGSTFKRPDKGYAARLIEDCGLKGLTVGGAMVSEKHSGFVINTGNATARDVLELISVVKKNVRDNTGVELELEIKPIP